MGEEKKSYPKMLYRDGSAPGATPCFNRPGMFHAVAKDPEQEKEMLANGYYHHKGAAKAEAAPEPAPKAAKPPKAPRKKKSKA